MKLNNKNYIIRLRILIAVLLFFLFLLLLMVGIYYKLLVTGIVLVLLIILYRSDYSELEFAGGCITFRKKKVRIKGYNIPFMEIPDLYLIDYHIEKKLWFYKVFITFNSDHSSHKKIFLSLVGYREHNIIKLIKRLQSIKNENRSAVERLLGSSK